MSDKKISTMDNDVRWHEVCKPAFDRARIEFEETKKHMTKIEDKIDKSRNSLETMIELNRQDIILLREKLNNGINARVDKLEIITTRLFWIIISASGTIIVAGLGFFITSILGIIK